ncbi:MAG: DUF6197 family protein [Pseudonocardia sp.]
MTTIPTRTKAAIRAAALLHAAADRILDHSAVVSIWNDDPTRAPGEVIAALRAAAERLDPHPPAAAERLDCSTSRPGGPSATSPHQAGPSSTRQHATSEVIGNV